MRVHNTLLAHKIELWYSDDHRSTHRECRTETQRCRTTDLHTQVVPQIYTQCRTTDLHTESVVPQIYTHSVVPQIYTQRVSYHRSTHTVSYHRSTHTVSYHRSTHKERRTTDLHTQCRTTDLHTQCRTTDLQPTLYVYPPSPVCTLPAKLSCLCSLRVIVVPQQGMTLFTMGCTGSCLLVLAVERVPQSCVPHPVTHV